MDHRFQTVSEEKVLETVRKPDEQNKTRRRSRMVQVASNVSDVASANAAGSRGWQAGAEKKGGMHTRRRNKISDVHTGCTSEASRDAALQGSGLRGVINPG